MPKLKEVKNKKTAPSGKVKKELVYSSAELSDLKKIGSGIARLIIDSGISIEKFAYENDLGKGHLSRIIRGQSDIKFCTLKTISKGLGFKNVASFLNATL